MKLANAIGVQLKLKRRDLAATLATIHGPRWRLLNISAGQLSHFVAQIGAVRCQRCTTDETAWPDWDFY
jgi:hypothetical protein